MTDRQVDKQNGMTIRLTLCDANVTRNRPRYMYVATGGIYARRACDAD